MKSVLHNLMKRCSRPSGRWRKLIRLFSGGAFLCPVLVGAAAQIQPLPSVPGGVYSVPKDVSDDGKTVVGFTTSTASGDGLEAFRWHAGEGTTGLGDLPPNDTAAFEFMSFAWKTSGDGSVVVGHGTGENGATLAFKWTSAAGLVSLGDLPGGDVFSQAKGVSDDGSVIVGYSTSADSDEAFRWTDMGGMAALGALPGATNSGVAWDVSADGLIIVGQAANADGYTEAFRWTQANGMVGLGDLPGGEFSSRAIAVSRNGRWIVGRSESARGKEPFVWSEATGMIGLGDLPGGAVEGRYDGDAFSVSDNGIVVGTSETVVGEDFGYAAFIWDIAHGIRELKQVLSSDFGLDMTGWTLESAEGISADGRFITGSGSDPDGNITSWLVGLPVNINPAAFTVTPLALTDSAGDSANKINDQGQITGTVDGNDGISRGYLYDTSTGQEVERAGYGDSAYTEWYGINAAGVLAGLFADPADPTFNTYRAFVRDASGSFTIITWPDDPDFGFSVDIDEHGRVAGGGNTTSWVWNPDGKFNVFNVPGFSVNAAWGMNDHGIIVGVAWPGFFDTPNGLIYNISNNTAVIWNYPGAAQTTLYGINNRGDIVGEFKPDLTSANIPFVRWADGTAQMLSLPGVSGARVYDINDDRVVVGRYKDAANKNRSFYAMPIAPLPEPLAFTFTAFDVPGANETLLADIRNDGTLVGRYKDQDDLSHGFFHSGETLTSFNVTGSTTTFACGIGEDGRVVGFYYDAADPAIQHGFIRDTDGTYTTIDGPGSVETTYLWRLNADGRINGYVFDSDPFFIRSFKRETDGSFEERVFPGSPLGTVTRGMNEVGDLAGWKWTDGFTLQGVVFHTDGTTNVFTIPGWEHTLPGDINNLGDIAGTVNNGFTNTAGFLRHADGAVTVFTPPGAVEVEVFGLNDEGVVVGEYVDAGGNRHGFIANPAVNLLRGHTDIGIAFEDGAFDLHVHDEETDTEYPPGGAVLSVGVFAEQHIPDTVAFSFLGRPGYSTWILPAVENEELLFLGLGAEEIESGLFVDDALSMELVSVQGAGDFALYSLDGFGNPLVHMNSADGIGPADAVALVAGSHSHLNWAFNAPGTYLIGLRASGTLADGNQPVTSEVAYYTFTVPAAQLTQPPEPDSTVYLVTDLGTLGGPMFHFGLDVNNQGEVVGVSNVREEPFTSHAFRYEGNGPIQDLGSLGGNGSSANSINEAGVIVGWAEAPEGGQIMRLRPGQPMESLGFAGWGDGANGINEAGVIVGMLETPEGDVRGFVIDTNDQTHDLGTFGGEFTAAKGINNSGVIVGWSRNSENRSRAFRHTGLGPLNPATDDIGTLGGPTAQATAINDAGKIVGRSTIADGSFRAFLWEEGSGMTDLGSLGGGNIWAFGINSQDTVVGWATIDPEDDFANYTQGWVWTPEQGINNLNSLMPRGAQHDITAAYGLNDQGWIAGAGYLLGTSSERPLLLKPATRLTHGHTDIGALLEEGALTLEVHAGALDAELRADQVLLNVAALAQSTVPNNPAFGFLGEPGSMTWILPQTAHPALLALGLAAEEIETGVFVNDEITFTLRSVEGPGHVFLYSTDGFGNPAVHWNSRDGLGATDSKTLLAGGHEHLSWAFSAPGYYHIGIEAAGTLVDGDQAITSGAITHHIEIVGVEPHLAIARLDEQTLALTLNTEDGIEYQVQSAATVNGPWSNIGQPFIGTGRDKQFSVPMVDGVAFYRVGTGIDN